MSDAKPLRGRCDHAAQDCADVRKELRNMIDEYPVLRRRLRVSEAERDALARRVEALRAALEEITSPPDASQVGADYGCLDFHEAKFIATHALAADDEAAK